MTKKVIHSVSVLDGIIVKIKRENMCFLWINHSSHSALMHFADISAGTEQIMTKLSHFCCSFVLNYIAVERLLTGRSSVESHSRYSATCTIWLIMRSSSYRSDKTDIIALLSTFYYPLNISNMDDRCKKKGYLTSACE